MDRLTKNNREDNKGDYYYPECLERCDGLGTSEKCNECDFCYAVCEKLGKYEDMEEQVVERLKEASYELFGNDGMGGELVINLDDAIKIVKADVEDDVCEWKLDGDMAINPHTFIKYKVKQYDSLYALDTCQYCGKKIKVVEYLTKSEKEAKLKELRGGEYGNKGCDTCKYEHRDIQDYPCSKCSHSYIDKYEPKTNADRIRKKSY